MKPTLPMLVDTNWLAAHLGDVDLRILDCSVGFVPVEGSVRLESGQAAWTAGHIPGSGNVSAASLVDPATGAYRSLEELRSRFHDAGALNAPRVIAYCGGGIAATSVAFTLLRLGAPRVAVYDGSLVDWSSDPALPMETG
jgi:3-mercaptopyruvate sulfurtransferase SseA